MAVYLGFDASTQSLTAIAIEVGAARRQVIYQRTVDFDRDLPHYGTRHGALRGDDPLVVTAPPMMWAEALDLMLALVARDGAFDVSKLAAVSGSAQQHGSVYLGVSAAKILAALDPARPLVDQLRGVFSRKGAPIWMDSSTSRQCAAIARAVGGGHVLLRLTGSRAFERFTGPQIRKFYEDDPEGYAGTDRIHLVSSFMASLLAGRHAPIEPGDGAGMNLMDIARRQWALAALRATAPGLELKLPPIVESPTIVGRLAPYWVRRRRLPPAKVVAWTGDNPGSLVGVGLVEPGRIAISLGTSDTVFGPLGELQVDPSGAGHVFGSPAGGYMSLVCFKNGSLAREKVRDEYRLNWDGFSRALRDTPPGNRGAIVLPWFEPEITPPVLGSGVRRYGLDPADGPANVRAIVEAQMLAMAIHSQWTGVRVATIHATGGAAVNRDILQVMADVHGADVSPLEVGNAAALGAALRAYHADLMSEGRPARWPEVVEGFVKVRADGTVRPVPSHVALYNDMKSVYAACEAHALRHGPDPAPMIEAFRRRAAG